MYLPDSRFALGVPGFILSPNFIALLGAIMHVYLDVLQQ